MKRLAITAALLGVMALPAAADGLLIRSNVPACEGSSFVSGFSVGGTYYVAEASADRVCNGAVVVPAGIDVYDLGEVLAYLAGIGVSATPLIQMGWRCEVDGEGVDNCSIPPVYGFVNASADHW